VGRGAKLAAQAVRSAHERRLEQLPRPEYGIVRTLSPLRIELVDANIVLEEGDIIVGSLELGVGDSVVGMFIGEDDDFFLFDSMTDAASTTSGGRKFKGDLWARFGATTQVKIGAVSGNPGISFGDAGDTQLYRDGAAGAVAVQGLYRAYGATAAATAFGTRVTGDTMSRLLIQSDGKHLWGPGGSSAQDVTLYRDQANLLRTDDALRVAGDTTLGYGVLVGALTGIAYRSNQVAGQTAFGNRLLEADANASFRILGSGQLEWGAGGGSAVDTALYRDAANVLASDDLLRVKRTTANTDYVFEGGVSTDTVFRYAVRADGRVEIGVGGSTARDVTLSRSAAGVLNVASKLQENTRFVWSKASGPGSNVGTGVNTAETDLSTFTVTGGTFPATGSHRVHILAAGEMTGSAGQRDAKLYFGGTVIATITIAAATAITGWGIEAWLHGTGTANLWKVVVKAWTSAGAVAIDPTPADTTVDPSVDFVIKVTGTTPNAADEVQSKVLDVDYALA
jgi:hypothetical protein